MRSWLASVDPRIWQAVIAGMFLAMGWVVNGWQNRRAAGRLRTERLRDYHRALYAEIGTALSNMWSEERLRHEAAGILARMRGDPTFVPFIPRERYDHVFDTLLPDVHVLPRQTIDPIVQYYAQIKAVDAFAGDMRGRRFPGLDQDRRIAIYGDFIEMKVQALAFGRFALAMIDAYARGGPAAADAEAARLSTPGADPSGRSPE